MYKKCFNKKVLAVSVMSLFFLQMLYVVVEPTVALASIGGEHYDLPDSMLVTLTVDPGIGLSVAEDTIMLPNLSMTNNKATGASMWNVITNNETGYNLTVIASSTPALASLTDDFVDYTDIVGITWTVATGAKEFGFSTIGADATSLQTTGDCIGAGDPFATSLNYQGFTGPITPITIASSNVVTPVAGTDTNICFGAEQNGVFADSGTYTATITATAVVNL